MSRATQATRPDHPAPQPNTDRIKRDARSLLKAKWFDLAIADHILLNNVDQTYGVYLTQESILAIIHPLLDEMNSSNSAAIIDFVNA